MKTCTDKIKPELKTIQILKQTTNSTNKHRKTQFFVVINGFESFKKWYQNFTIQNGLFNMADALKMFQNFYSKWTLYDRQLRI